MLCCRTGSAPPLLPFATACILRCAAAGLAANHHHPSQPAPDQRPRPLPPGRRQRDSDKRHRDRKLSNRGEARGKSTESVLVDGHQLARTRRGHGGVWRSECPCPRRPVAASNASEVSPALYIVSILLLLFFFCLSMSSLYCCIGSPPLYLWSNGRNGDRRRLYTWLSLRAARETKGLALISSHPPASFERRRTAKNEKKKDERRKTTTMTTK